MNRHEAEALLDGLQSVLSGGDVRCKDIGGWRLDEGRPLEKGGLHAGRASQDLRLGAELVHLLLRTPSLGILLQMLYSPTRVVVKKLTDRVPNSRVLAGIVTPYSAQVKRLTEMVQQRFRATTSTGDKPWHDLEIQSVDAYQGR
jgi:hypothetical protein